jgi:hypothetical protein
MNSDPRCCGTGTCIINSEGVCWCGQVWDGEKMCMPKLNSEDLQLTPASETQSSQGDETPLSTIAKSS